MGTLTNSFKDVEMWNLNPGGAERGPYLVVQAGIAPGDDLVRESLFLLRPDGKWVDAMAIGAAGKPELLDAVLFPTSEAVMTLLGTLGARAEVEPTTVTDAELQTWIQRTAGTDPMQRVRSFLEGYRERHAAP